MREIIKLFLETFTTITIMVVITVLFCYIFILKYIYHSTAITVYSDIFSNLNILLIKAKYIKQRKLVLMFFMF